MAATERYAQVAKAAGVTLCGPDTCDCTGLHEGIYWDRPRFTSVGAYRLLRKIYDERLLGQGPTRAWDWRYTRAMWVTARARDAKVRLPKGIWAEERARTREDLARYADRIPPAARSTNYAQVVRWATR